MCFRCVAIKASSSARIVPIKRSWACAMSSHAACSLGGSSVVAGGFTSSCGGRAATATAAAGTPPVPPDGAVAADTAGPPVPPVGGTGTAAVSSSPCGDGAAMLSTSAGPSSGVSSDKPSLDNSGLSLTGSRRSNFTASFDTDPLLSSFTRYAYLKVFRECSTDPALGDRFAIIKVRQLSPTSESFRTCVSLLPRKGVWSCCWSRARMHSLSARSDLLISAPSILVWRSVSVTSAPLSLPAKSIKENLPWTRPFWVSFKQIWRMAWDLDESTFAPVQPVVRSRRPYSITPMSCCTFSKGTSCNPTITTCPLAFSLAWSNFLLFSKSNSFPQ
mmetsp:Transcript_35897/g.86411  ORF Transcript_35897/g.86411 Transcript_35897/m.86411 type:complete len:331 (-) Transcript_35897:651-1643(-)